MTNSRRLAFFVPALVGAVGLFQFTQRPGFVSFRSVDVVWLLGCGMCFGFALAGLFAFLRRGTRDRQEMKFWKTHYLAHSCGFHCACRSASRWGEHCRACFTWLTAASHSQPRDQ